METMTEKILGKVLNFVYKYVQGISLDAKKGACFEVLIMEVEVPHVIYKNKKGLLQRRIYQFVNIHKGYHQSKSGYKSTKHDKNLDVK